MTTKPLPFYLFVAGIVVIATVSVVKNFYPGKTTTSVTPNQVSNPTSALSKITQPNALFTSQIFLQRNKTAVVIPIKFERQTQTAWLILDSSESAKPSQWLITHPQLEKINWPSINDADIYLYQRRTVYKSLADFLKRPPQKDKLVMDEVMPLLPKFKNLQGITLTDTTDLSSVDFVLTTYRPATVKDGVIQYANLIDASIGTVGGSLLNWQVAVPTATIDNPYYIGNIHIDYQ